VTVSVMSGHEAYSVSVSCPGDLTVSPPAAAAIDNESWRAAGRHGPVGHGDTQEVRGRANHR